MNDTPLIFIDIETTGTRATRDRITEIAALKINGGHVVERWVSLIQPTTGVPAHISRLTGIDDAMLKAELFRRAYRVEHAHHVAGLHRDRRRDAARESRVTALLASARSASRCCAATPPSCWWTAPPPSLP